MGMFRGYSVHGHMPPSCARFTRRYITFGRLTFETRTAKRISRSREKKEKILRKKKLTQKRAKKKKKREGVSKQGRQETSIHDNKLHKPENNLNAPTHPHVFKKQRPSPRPWWVKKNRKVLHRICVRYRPIVPWRASLVPAPAIPRR